MRLLLASLVLLFACSASAVEKLKVVTSFSILADMTRQVAGDDVDLYNLVGADADAHIYQPSAADARALVAADLIIANGLGFEPWLKRLIASSEARAPLLEASKGLLPLMLEEDSAQVADPHAWQNLANAEIYVRNIAAELSQADPANAARYALRRDAYLLQIGVVLEEARADFADLDAGER